jgi:hypothetical protein
MLIGEIKFEDPETNIILTVDKNGIVRTFKNYLLQSINGEPSVYNPYNGYKSWHKQGILHRENGPALICKKCCVYYFEGKKHRDDGPAIELSDGRKKWFVYGVNKNDIAGDKDCILM